MFFLRSCRSWASRANSPLEDDQNSLRSDRPALFGEITVAGEVFMTVWLREQQQALQEILRLSTSYGLLTGVVRRKREWELL
jgi:hypothetical protein